MASHDIFICYSSKDEAQARALMRHLEGQGWACWIACRDVRPGRNYQESIVQALRNAKAVTFLFSDHSNKTNEVKKELSLASSFEVPVIPFRITSSTPNGALMYELATRQWIDAIGNFEAALAPLTAAIRETLAHAAADVAAAPVPTIASIGAPPTTARSPILSPESTEFEALRVLLAYHVGPMAKIFVQKASAEATDAGGLCAQLAVHIRGAADRESFVKKARMILKALETAR